MDDFGIEVRVTVTTSSGPIELSSIFLEDSTIHAIMDDVEEFLKKREESNSTIHAIMDDVEEFLIMKGEKNDSTNSD